MNIRTRILIQLNSAKEPMRKHELANALNVSVSSCAHPLAELNAAFLIHQSKGFYRITPDGRAALDSDPSLADFFTARTYSRITLKFKPEDFNTFVCQALLPQFTKAVKAEGLQEYYRRVLLPFVMMYLIASGKDIPVGNAAVGEPTPQDINVGKAIQLFIAELD